MAGEFGRAVSDLGAGLMARSQRRRELEEQKLLQAEQRKYEEESYVRKQKLLAEISAEQEKAKEAARVAREREKAMQPKLMNVPGVGLVDTRRGEDGSVSVQTLLQVPQSQSVQTRTFNGMVQQLMPDGSWKPLGTANTQQQLTTADLKISTIEGQLAGAEADLAYLRANPPAASSKKGDWQDSVRKAESAVARYRTTLESMQGKPFTLSDDGLAKSTPLMEADPFHGGGYTDRMDQARATTTPAQPPDKKERIGDVAARVDATLVKENDPMLANAYQVALDRLRVQKQKAKQPITPDDYERALEWARRNKDRVGQYFGEE